MWLNRTQAREAHPAGQEKGDSGNAGGKGGALGDEAGGMVVSSSDLNGH